MNKKEILTSLDVREDIVADNELLEKLAQTISFKVPAAASRDDLKIMRKTKIAGYYEVSFEELNKCIDENRKEIRRAGYKIYKKSKYPHLIDKCTKNDEDEGGFGLFDFAGFVTVGLLLKNNKRGEDLAQLISIIDKDLKKDEKSSLLHIKIIKENLSNYISVEGNDYYTVVHRLLLKEIFQNKMRKAIDVLFFKMEREDTNLASEITKQFIKLDKLLLKDIEKKSEKLNRKLTGEELENLVTSFVKKKSPSTIINNIQDEYQKIVDTIDDEEMADSATYSQQELISQISGFFVRNILKDKHSDLIKNTSLMLVEIDE